VNYTQAQIDTFWWGSGGSAGNPTSGAYVTMTPVQVIQLTNVASAAYNASFATILNYLMFKGRVAGVHPTGANGFLDQSTIGGQPITTRW
jgi:hypothetical protein